MSSSRSFEYGRFATAPRGRTSSKSSVFKRLKKLVVNSDSASSSTRSSTRSNTASFTPVEVQRRRAQALKSCGLFKQSVKYGTPYRDEDEDEDEDDDAITIVSPEKHIGGDAGKLKDLLIFDEDGEFLKDAQEKEYICDSGDEKTMSPYSPTTSHMPLSPCAASNCSSSDSASIAESDTSTLAPQHPPIRIRRIGSVCAELEHIEDEESRRLTEVAFLS